MRKNPKFIKFNGDLVVDNNDEIALNMEFVVDDQRSGVKYLVPLSELVEDMINKEVEIKIYETKDGKKIIDSSTLKAINEDRIRGSRSLREQLIQDKYRPGYHFVVPEDIGIPGDPNGAFFGKDGRYHLMYLYNRRDVKFNWGHISSLDLVHWRHHHDAITREDDIDGCFSGGAFLDEDGTAYICYWIVQDNERPEAKKGIAIAKSNDYHYENWENLPEVAIPSIKMGESRIIDKDGTEKIVANADPSNIWKKDDTYYMQTGNIILLNEYGRDPKNPLYEEFRGDWVDLFKSSDLQNWEYVHRFYDFQPEKKWTDGTEDDMCPSFLPLPLSAEGGRMSDKYLQLFIAHNKGCQYYIGTYDKDNDRFIPEKHGRMSWMDNTYFAPEALIDAKGRQIMWAWLLDDPDPHQNQDKIIERGWCGVYGLPRVLWLGEDGTLRQTVPSEFEMLRYNEKTWDSFILKDGLENKMKLDGVIGDSCEISLKCKIADANTIGFQVCTNPDEKEKTILLYDYEESSLVFDSINSSLDGIGRPLIEVAPFILKNKSDLLDIRVFIDKCVVEIYINNTQAICRRVFTTLDESLGIYLFCEGGNAMIKELIAWEMMPSNPY